MENQKRGVKKSSPEAKPVWIEPPWMLPYPSRYPLWWLVSKRSKCRGRTNPGTITSKGDRLNRLPGQYRNERSGFGRDPILTWGRPTEGTALTIRLARRHGKPCLVVDLISYLLRQSSFVPKGAKAILMQPHTPCQSRSGWMVMGRE